MDSELLAKWTTIITNIAVVIGLLFVGLEYRGTTRAIEAERIDSFIFSSDIGFKLIKIFRDKEVKMAFPPIDQIMINLSALDSRLIVTIETMLYEG